MLKQTLLCGVASCAALPGTAMARPEIPYANLPGSAAAVTFDTMTGHPTLGLGEVLGAQYAGQGVTFSTPNFNTYATNGVIATLSTLQTDPNVVWADQGGGGAGPLAVGINADFTVPVRRVGAWMGGTGSSTFRITAYNGTTLLETVGHTLPTAPLGAEGFIAIERSELITRIVFTAANSGGQNWNFSIDDVKFDAGATCYPDCNQSGTLTIADFACFQSAFVAGAGYADCNQSGTLTIADFACFQAAFSSGCP